MASPKQAFPAKGWKFSWPESPDNWEKALEATFGTVPAKGWIAVRGNSTETQRPRLQGFVSFTKKVRKTSLKLHSGMDFAVATGGLKENVRQFSGKHSVAKGCCCLASARAPTKKRLETDQGLIFDISGAKPRCKKESQEGRATDAKHEEKEAPIHWVWKPLQMTLTRFGLRLKAMLDAPPTTTTTRC